MINVLGWMVDLVVYVMTPWFLALYLFPSIALSLATATGALGQELEVRIVMLYFPYGFVFVALCYLMIRFFKWWTRWFSNWRKDLIEQYYQSKADLAAGKDTKDA